MTVLVTGGAGYIGSHTVRLLTQVGREVVVYDSLELGHRARVSGVPLVVGDVADRALVEQTMRDYNVDSVIHFAAYKAAGESMTNPAKYFRNIVGGSLALLEATVAADVRRFVFSSTAALYGTPERVPITEDMPLHPENAYGEAKLMVEQMLDWFDRIHGLRSARLRYFNAAGASGEAAIGEDWNQSANLLPQVMRAALEKGPKLRVFGTDYSTADGTCIRDYIHVDDLADAHVKALQYLEREDRSLTVNLGTGTGNSVREVIDEVERVSGVRVPRDEVDRRPGDPAILVADNQRARELLGWVPAYRLEQIVESAWKWHATHVEGPE
jgi:UDP-glucose 4-epimerase